MNKIIILIGMILLSPTCLAKWSTLGTINSVYSHNGYNVIETTIADNPCGSSGKFYWPISDDDAKDMLSIALVALTAQKNVRVVFDDVNTSCSWSGSLSTHLMISK